MSSKAIIATAKRSLTDLARFEIFRTPPELDETLYLSDVLQLHNGDTEGSLEAELFDEGFDLGLDISTSGRVGEPGRPRSAPESIRTRTTSGRPRSASVSQASRSTLKSSRSSVDLSWPSSRGALSQHRMPFSKPLSFDEYEKYIANTNGLGSNSHASMYRQVGPSFTTQMPPSFSSSTKRSSSGLKRGIRRLSHLPKGKGKDDGSLACTCCREEFEHPKALRVLHCAHTYCTTCLRILIHQAAKDEFSMPPKCCNHPFTGSTIKSVLGREEQQEFIKRVLQYAVPWEERIYCPNTSCREFLPKKMKVDPMNPFVVVCKRCRTPVCKQCKREAHRVGQDCPADWELDAVLEMGETQGWRRCYKCRALVELIEGCTHMTCRCRAEFCYVCGAIWDRAIGCPNFCDGERELERRRREERQRKESMARAEAEHEAAQAAIALEALEAAKRTAESSVLRDLREQHHQEMERFVLFEKQQRIKITARHGAEKWSLLHCQTEIEQNMKSRHRKLIITLEDRQVFAEMDLRHQMKVEKKSCRARLHYMEVSVQKAEVDKENESALEHHRSELRKEESIGDQLDRKHQARINALRHKQAQQLEALTDRLDNEWETLQDKSTAEMEEMEVRFESEEANFLSVFKSRKARLNRRWALANDVARRRLEVESGMSYGSVPSLEWPAPLSQTVGLASEA